jgi:NADH-quinone oxidoreductase subunit J
MFGRPSQRELSEQRFASGSGNEASPLPNPGIFARHNSVDTPGLLPDGSVAEDSLSKVLVARGTYRVSGEAARDIEKLGIEDPGAPPPKPSAGASGSVDDMGGSAAGPSAGASGSVDDMGGSAAGPSAGASDEPGEERGEQ